MTGTFSSRHKAKFYVFEENNLISSTEIYHVTVAFSPEKKNNSSLKDWTLSYHPSFYSAVSRIPWKQISQHFSKLFWPVGTESCGAREALLLPQATADRRQCLQGHHLHGVARSTLESHNHCVRFNQCCYPYWSTLHFQKIFPFLFRRCPAVVCSFNTITKHSSVTVCIWRDATHIQSMCLSLSLLLTHTYIYAHMYIYIHIYIHTSLCISLCIPTPLPPPWNGPEPTFVNFCILSAASLPHYTIQSSVGISLEKDSSFHKQMAPFRMLWLHLFLCCHCFISCYPRLHAAKTWY